jgi:hypothetical protein
MKGYHVHRGTTRSKLELKVKDGKFLWYTTHTDSGWLPIEKSIGMQHYGGFSVFEVDIPSTSITTQLDPPNPKKVFKLTRENYKAFAKKYNADPHGFDKEEMTKDFAGVDANDKTLARTHAYMGVNGGPPSGAVWRFSDTGIHVKRVLSDMSHNE